MALPLPPPPPQVAQPQRGESPGVSMKAEQCLLPGEQLSQLCPPSLGLPFGPALAHSKTWGPGQVCADQLRPGHPDLSPGLAQGSLTTCD